MRVRVHIERLVLEELPVTSAQGAQVQAGLETELARLIAAHGISEELRHGVSLPRMRAREARVHPESPAKTGRTIAQSIFGSLGKLR